jgi:hypothetical protein
MDFFTETESFVKLVFPFILTCVGAFALYLCSRNRGIRPFSIFYALNIDVGITAKPMTITLDAILTSLLGAVIGYAVTQPGTNAQAVAAGFGFVGIINTLGGSHGSKESSRSGRA